MKKRAKKQEKISFKKELPIFSKKEFIVFVNNQFSQLIKKNLEVPIQLYRL